MLFPCMTTNWFTLGHVHNFFLSLCIHTRRCLLVFELPFVSVLLRLTTAPCNPKEQKPTLKSLDEEVVVRVAGRWETIGVHLDIEDFVLQAIKTPNGSNEDHCHEMFRRWLAGAQGCGPLPRTWSSVLHAVHKGCGSEVCKDITELLHQNE